MTTAIGNELELRELLSESRETLARLSEQVQHLPEDRKCALGALGCFLDEARAALTRAEEQATGSEERGGRESAPDLESAVEHLTHALDDAREEYRKVQWGQSWL
jgi:hypothetical protein